MLPRIIHDQSMALSRPSSPEGDSKKGYDGDLSGLAESATYQWQDLLNLNLPPADFDAVLTSVLRSSVEMEKIQGLNEQELQGVIDVLGQYLGTGDVMNELRKRCFKSLCKICAIRGALPTPYMLKPSDLQRPEVPDYTGGFGAVWKGKAGETTVAIKRLLIHVTPLEKLKERFCHEVIIWRRFSNPNTLNFIGAYMQGSELVMVSEWMDNGNITQYLRKNPEANKLSLLIDIARGVIYLHGMNVVHGDLKGVNILVKDDGSACLADFGLMSIVLDPEITDITTSSEGGAKGTYRWMSPELFYPNDFGLFRFHLTKESDCYAFGMVIYEVLSGKIPLEEVRAQWRVPIAVHKGVRPSIPEKNPPKMMEVWSIAQECWSQNPWDRPSFQTVLDKLENLARTDDVTPFVLRELRPTPTGSLAAYLRYIVNGDPTSPQEIARALTNALDSDDYDTCVKDLPSYHIDPQSYIDGLDRAIDILSPKSDNHWRCVWALSEACGIYGLLPESHKVKFTLMTGEHAIASGGFSDTWKASNEKGEVFAIKVLRLYQNNAAQVKKKYSKEIIISRRTNHPNVLRIEGVALDLFPCCMVSRWMENGNMLDYLNRYRGPIDRLELLLGIIRGLDYLHKYKVVHGNLKSYNILISAEGVPCLADFGLFSIAEGIYSVSGSNALSGGFVRWSAPEIIGLVNPTTQSDIYSLAMVIIEVFTGKIPFPEAMDVQVIIMMSRGERPPKPPGREALGLGSELWKLTEDCWNQNPGRRPDTANVLRRLRYIVNAGDEGVGFSTPVRKIFRRVTLNESTQHRINKLDQELEKGLIPEDEVPSKLNELRKLCSCNDLIPDSMKLKGDDEKLLYVAERLHPAQVFQRKFKGGKIAVKIARLYVPQRADELLRRFGNEVVAWKHLRHPNILPLLGVTLCEQKLCLIFEWMDQGNINEYLGHTERSEVNRIELLVEVVAGLSYMHRLQVVHGNLKGANIYIRNFRACIADFGLSTIARADPLVGKRAVPAPSFISFSPGGSIRWLNPQLLVPKISPLASLALGESLRWMSPELLNPQKFNVCDPGPTKESDRFALGMVIYEVLCGHVPYEGLDSDMISDAILNGIRPSKPEAAAHLGLVDELWDILQRCWDEKREARPDLLIVRACLDVVTPMWHARKNLPLIPGEEAV